MGGRMRADVVVVGGGPVGLLVAAELAGFGVRTVVFEAEPAVSDRPRATTVHARAVQCLVRRGRLPWLAPLHQKWGREVTRSFRFAGISGLTISAPGTEPEPLLKCPQRDLEREFEAQALAAGARILRGYRVEKLRMEADGVQVTARARDAREDVACTASYVVGADGARGVVRELAGIGSATWPATVSSMMGLVALPDRDRLGPGWHRTPRGWIVATPVSGEDVSLRTLNPDPANARTARASAPTPEELRREVAWIAGHEVALRRPRWLSRFDDFARLARGYRRGRVLLVGDAAHIHFPIGGQGLSTGLLDAIDLSWKLAFTIRGSAAADLLDSYDAERRPAALRVIGNTRGQLLLMRPDPDLAPVRGMLAERLAAEQFSARLGAAISAQDTVVPARTAHPSPWEGRFLPNRRLETRRGPIDVISLLRPGRPLLVLSGPGADAYRRQAAPWARLLRVVHAAALDPLPEALLLRPDGYIGWAAGGSALADALTAYFGPPVGAEASSKTRAPRSADRSTEASTEEIATLGSTCRSSVTTRGIRSA